MRASFLRLLLVAGMVAPAISLAAGNNPFVPSAPANLVADQIEDRIRALEDRALKAEEHLRELIMENLPTVPGELLKGSPAAQGDDVADGVEVIGMINGKCLVKRMDRLEEEATNGPCVSQKSAVAEPAPNH